MRVYQDSADRHHDPKSAVKHLSIGLTASGSFIRAISQNYCKHCAPTEGAMDHTTSCSCRRKGVEQRPGRKLGGRRGTTYSGKRDTMTWSRCNMIRKYQLCMCYILRLFIYRSFCIFSNACSRSTNAAIQTYTRYRAFTCGHHPTGPGARENRISAKSTHLDGPGLPTPPPVRCPRGQ